MRLSCTKCGITVATLYLKAHMARIHGICVPQTRGFEEVGELPTTYVVSFPRVLHMVKFPVLGCLEVAHSAVILQDNFMYRYFLSNVSVVQEGMEPLTRYDLCGMHMPEGRLIKHRRTA